MMAIKFLGTFRLGIGLCIMIHLYLYKIESLNLGGGVLIVQKCEALNIICLRIQHGMKCNMGYLDHQFSHYSAKYAWLKFCTRFVSV